MMRVKGKGDNGDISGVCYVQRMSALLLRMKFCLECSYRISRPIVTALFSLRIMRLHHIAPLVSPAEGSFRDNKPSETPSLTSNCLQLKRILFPTSIWRKNNTLSVPAKPGLQSYSASFSVICGNCFVERASGDRNTSMAALLCRR